MLELSCRERRWQVAPGSNLLDALNLAGLNVPFSCRAGICHACLVRCVEGEPADDRPDALDASRRQQGWRLACQCSVVTDLTVELHDPEHDGLHVTVVSANWLVAGVLQLRLQAEGPFRYRAGQHVVLWNMHGVARPYSLASLPGEDPWLEFHLDCRAPGAFVDHARTLKAGGQLRLGQRRDGALRYEADWQYQPLLLLAAGTGLAPLLSLLREALRQAHVGPIRLLHFDEASSYASEALEALADHYSQLHVEQIERSAFAEVLPSLQIASRQEVALICGGPRFVEGCARRLFMAGLPRGQVLSDTFIRQPVER